LIDNADFTGRSDTPLPPKVAANLAELAKGYRATAFAFHAAVQAAGADGASTVHDVAVIYRNDYLSALRSEGRDADREAGRLSMDEVCEYLLTSTLPRLSEAGLLMPLSRAAEPYETRVQIDTGVWGEIVPLRERVAEAAFRTGEHSSKLLTRKSAEYRAQGSVLEVEGLTKMYRKRKVVNDVGLRLQQGEIVGLRGPNGAGKTTTVYRSVVMIPPLT